MVGVRRTHESPAYTAYSGALPHEPRDALARRTMAALAAIAVNPRTSVRPPAGLVDVYDLDSECFVDALTRRSLTLLRPMAHPPRRTLA
jgi:hypothetical protein